MLDIMNHYMEFKRKVYSDLLEWKDTDHGTTAALIEGARRVGKTTVAEQFGKNEYRSYILIDFSITDKAVSDLFENFSGDLDDFFMRLQFHTGRELHERQSLVIFDEIQLYPKARQMTTTAAMMRAVSVAEMTLFLLSLLGDMGAIVWARWRG